MRPDYASAMQQFHELPEDQGTLLIMSVPTFNDSQPQVVHISQMKTKLEDPFLYYSNDDVRMKRLMGKDNNSTATQDSHDDGSQGRVQDSAGTGYITRKTRLSYEVHPSLFFEDSQDEERSSHLDLDAAPKKIAENTQLSPLIKALFGEVVKAKTCIPRAA
jgi:hypothetical protein